jgi:hypothetical protein
MFLGCARLCCLCLRFCGTKIEAAHIIDKHAGGLNSEDNGIPVCFDCHHDMGSYNDEHPKGNKYRPVELRARRDRLYELVASGALFAHLVAAQARTRSGNGFPDIQAVESGTGAPSSDARNLLRRIKDDPDALGSKLRLLSEDDIAWLLDSLLKRTRERIPQLGAVLAAEELSDSQRYIAVERAIRTITIDGTARNIVAAIKHFPFSCLRKLEQPVRHALFHEAIEIMERDNYNDVNVLTPAIIQCQEAIPPALRGPYVRALFSQARSGAWHGGPAAKRALMSLPNRLARAGLRVLVSDLSLLLSCAGEDKARKKKFIKQYEHLVADEPTAQVLSDFYKLSVIEFAEKYDEDPE